MRGRARIKGSNLAAALCYVSREGWAGIYRTKVAAKVTKRAEAYMKRHEDTPSIWPDMRGALRHFKSKGWVGRVKGGRYFLTRRGAKAARIACALLPRSLYRPF